MISIIALLISILLPALSKARDAARAIQCGSQIRQVVIGLTTYAGDNDDQLPWFEFDKNHVERPYTTWPQALATRNNYVAGADAFFCPEQDRSQFLPARLNALSSPTPTQSNEGVRSISYGANRYGAMPHFDDAGFKPIKIGQVREASELMLLVEAFNTKDAYNGIDWFNPGSGNSHLAMRHSAGGSAWAAYLDGHAVQSKAEALGWDVQLGNWSPLRPPSSDRPWFHSVYTKSN